MKQHRTAFAWSQIQERVETSCPLWDKIEIFTHGRRGKEIVTISINPEDEPCLDEALVEMGLSGERVLGQKHPGWTKAERAYYANATVRVLGETDHSGRLLVEITSGPLFGERRWMTESELQRKEHAS